MNINVEKNVGNTSRQLENDIQDASTSAKSNENKFNYLLWCRDCFAYCNCKKFKSKTLKKVKSKKDKIGRKLDRVIEKKWSTKKISNGKIIKQQDDVSTSKIAHDFKKTNKKITSRQDSSEELPKPNDITISKIVRDSKKVDKKVASHRNSSEELPKKRRIKRKSKENSVVPKKKEDKTIKDETIEIHEKNVQPEKRQAILKSSTPQSSDKERPQEYSKLLVQDFEKTCCYLCVQNTATIVGGISTEPERIENHTETFIKKLDDKESSSTSKAIVPCSNKNTRGVAVACPGPSTEPKRKKRKWKFFKIFQKRNRKKCSGKCKKCKRPKITVCVTCDDKRCCRK